MLLYNPIAAVARGEAERLYAKAFGRGESLLKTKNAGAWLREDGADGPSVIHALGSLNRSKVSSSRASPCSSTIPSTV